MLAKKNIMSSIIFIMNFTYTYKKLQFVYF